MKYLILALPLVAAACASDYDSGYAPGYYVEGYYGPGPSRYYQQEGQYPAPSRYTNNEGYYGQPYSGENCGTPDEPQACPPLPRHPLPYYPGDR